MSQIGVYQNIERDKEIARLASLGVSDEELGRRFLLSLRQIARIRRTLSVYKITSKIFNKGQP